MSATRIDADAVIDTSNCVLGRVASTVAERAIDGEAVAVVNAERAVITGSRDDVMETYRDRAGLGSDRGPMHPRRPDGILKRSIRGMLPTDRSSGRDAFEQVRVYLGNPYDGTGAGADLETIDHATLDRRSTTKFVHLGEISEHLGATKTW